MRAARPLEWQIVDDVLVVRVLETCVVFPKEVEPVNDALTRLVKKERDRHVVINMAQVRYLSSSALGVLVKVHKSVSTAGQKLRICGLNDKLRENFAITQLDRLLDLHENESTALEGLKK